MSFDFFEILKLIGALGFFIYGMKVMSEGIQKVAGSKLRGVLEAMTSNRFKGIFTGFLITSLVQSSSATTVMVVSFVNAGLISLVESVGVIMGANIGTTLTAWLITIFGFKIKVASFALPIIAVGFPMLFSSKSKLRSWGEVLIGFALLFLGLEALKNTVPNLKDSPEALQFIKDFTGMGLLSIITFVGVGTLLTVMVQSSSAAMALTIIMCNYGWIPFELAAAMVLGENIGTTITANLASIVGNVHAKRAARAHFIINVFGVIWMIFALPYVLGAIDHYLVTNHDSSPFTNAQIIPVGLSIFHTTFNIINVLLLIGFVGFIVKVVTRMVPSKGVADEEFRLEYIGEGVISTPEIAILEARKEIAVFGKLTAKMSNHVQTLLNDTKEKTRIKLFNKVRKYEDITDKMEVEIANYLSKIGERNITEASSLKIRGMLGIVNDLERIGDILYQMSKIIERKDEEELVFTAEQLNNLNELFKLLTDAFEIMLSNLESEYETVVIDKAKYKEVEINKLRNKIRRAHLKSIEMGDYNIKSGLIYSDLFSSCEKVGDHIINVTEGITGEI